MGQISITGHADDFTLTGEVDDVLAALRSIAREASAAPVSWQPMLAADGYEVLVAGEFQGDVRSRTDIEGVDGGIYEWTAHDPVEREWRSGLCRDLHWGVSAVEKVVKGWLRRPGTGARFRSRFHFRRLWLTGVGNSAAGAKQRGKKMQNENEIEIQWALSVYPEKPTETYFAMTKAIPGEGVARVAREGDRWLWASDGERGYEETLGEAQDKAEETIRAMIHRLTAEEAAGEKAE